jgi:hypothetical protein
MLNSSKRGGLLMDKIEKLHPELLSKYKSPLFQLITILNDYRDKTFETYASLVTEIRPKFIMSLFTYLSQKKNIDEESLKRVISHLIEDPVIMEAALTLVSIVNPTYYVVQKDFFSKFLKTKLDSVKFSDLPAYLTGYMKVPLPIIDEDGDEFNHIYFFIGDDKDFFPIKDWRYGNPNAINHIKNDNEIWSSSEQLTSLPKGKRIIQIVLLKEDPDLMTSETSVRTFGIRFPEDDSILISDLLNGKFDSESKLGYPSYLRIVINLILYLSTGEPDIRDFRNKSKVPGEKKKSPIRTSDILSCLPIKLVGYNWKKNIIKTFSVQSWTRDGHFRWQRYGEKLGLVKLIWIDDQVVKRQL